MNTKNKAMAAAFSIMIIVPVVTLVSVLALNLLVQQNMAYQSAARQADLAAEEAKMLLRVSVLRGPANQTLLNLYGAGKLPITLDYLLVQAKNGTVLAEKSGSIITVNPGDNLTITPSALDPRLAVYDNDFWKMRREVGRLTLHSPNGGSYDASWGVFASSKPTIRNASYTTTFTTSSTTVTLTTTTTSFETSTTFTTRTLTMVTYTETIYATAWYQYTAYYSGNACYISCSGATTVYFLWITRWVGPTVTTVTVGPYTQPFTVVYRTVFVTTRTATPATVTFYIFSWGTGGIYTVEATTTVTYTTSFTATSTITVTPP